ncbi:MAG: Rpn family recombination-promoting nuclease/putative transposase [Firmicutes bacterium]|nr:Rpn family recombination-promoting nuclease/putative transposase [Bacillota bacterium]
MLNNRHDKGYKYLLSVKKVFVQLLKSFVRQDWVHKIDEDSVEQINRSFILQDFNGKEADLVYKVRIDGREVFFYMLSEEELLQLGNLIGAVFYINQKPRYDEIIMRLKKLVEQLNKMSKEDLKLFKVWLKNIATCGMTEEETGEIEKIIDENKEVDEMVYALEIVIRIVEKPYLA